MKDDGCQRVRDYMAEDAAYWRAAADRWEKRYAEIFDKLKVILGVHAINVAPTDEQAADWAYGNTKTSNHDVTRAMANDAVRHARGCSTRHGCAACTCGAE